MNILILTTAINRSKLHNKTFESFKKFLSKDDKIRWVINIDRIDALKENTVDTKRNILRIFKGWNNINFLFHQNSDGKGWFNGAVRRIVKSSKVFVDGADIVLYLEDDYNIYEDQEQIDLESIIKGCKLDDSFVVNLRITKLKRHSNPYCFQPQIWSRKAFKGFINVYDQNKDTQNCPEWILTNNFEKINKDLKIKFTSNKIFESARVGRKWLDSQGIVKIGNFYRLRSEVDLERNRMFYLGKEFDTDKITTHHYYEIYDKYFRSFYDMDGSILEIGTHKRESIKMWLKLFPNMFIYGADIRDKGKGERFRIFRCDQSKEEDLYKLISLIDRPVHIINDDGSHIPEHQLLTFNKLFPKLQNGGLYIIEDIETSYWNSGKYSGKVMNYGKGSENSIVEIFKSAVDSVNSHIIGIEEDSKVKHLDFISSITFDRNCIIIGKGNKENPDYYKRRKFIK